MTESSPNPAINESAATDGSVSAPSNASTDKARKDDIHHQLEAAALRKQILGLGIISLLSYLFFSFFQVKIYAILVIIAATFAFIDAWISGIRSIRDDENILRNVSPLLWALLMILIPLLTCPLYVANRNKLKTKSESNLYFVLTILAGIGSIIQLTAIQVVYVINKAQQAMPMEMAQ